MVVYLLGTVVHINVSQTADILAASEHSVQAVVGVVLLPNKQIQSILLLVPCRYKSD